MMSTMMKNNSINSDYEAKKLLNFSIKFSYSLLYNGAEVYRVEDSINRICKSFQNVKAVNTFALSNMVIISFVYNGTNYTSMRRLNDSGKNLEKIALLNELSRNIVSGKVDVDEAFKELKNIKNKSSYSNFTTILLITLSAPFLAFIFGGTLSDFIPASMAMLVEMLFLIYIGIRVTFFFNDFFICMCSYTFYYDYVKTYSYRKCFKYYNCRNYSAFSRNTDNKFYERYFIRRYFIRNNRYNVCNIYSCFYCCWCCSNS